MLPLGTANPSLRSEGSAISLGLAMKPLSRLSAWFYDYPDFNVTEQEFGVLSVLKEKPIREQELSPKVGIPCGDLRALLERLRCKRLIASSRRRFGSGLYGALTAETGDAERFWLSRPGAMMFRERALPARRGNVPTKDL
jgi:hypothetical protein